MSHSKYYKDFNVTSGKKIFEMRTRRHYTRKYLSKKAGISPKFLYEIEAGKKGCSSYVLYRLADALDVSVDYLLDVKTAESEKIEELCGHFHGSQRESLAAIVQLMYEMIQND